MKGYWKKLSKTRLRAADPSTIWRIANAFTLIELLVGIAILAILAALLLPALGTAQ